MRRRAARAPWGGPPPPPPPPPPAATSLRPAASAAAVALGGGAPGLPRARPSPGAAFQPGSSRARKFQGSRPSRGPGRGASRGEGLRAFAPGGSPLLAIESGIRRTQRSCPSLPITAGGCIQVRHVTCRTSTWRTPTASTSLSRLVAHRTQLFLGRGPGPGASRASSRSRRLRARERARESQPRAPSLSSHPCCLASTASQKLRDRYRYRV